MVEEEEHRIPKVHHSVRNYQPLVFIRNHINPVHIIKRYFFKIHFNIILASNVEI
jgi:hypothetical protein